eukprot:gene12042-14085_t
MNDEANPDLPSVVNQISQGHAWLMDTFGVVPENGWQIDPFGHSSATPTILAQMGMKNLVLNRISGYIKGQMADKHDLQFVWRGSHAMGKKSDIFAHVLDQHYSHPDGYESAWNPAYKLEMIIHDAVRKQRVYGIPHILVPMGDDFTYQYAYQNFDSIDGLLTANIQIKYSTLHDYFTELAEWASTSNKTFNYYDGDFYPYGRPGDWWTNAMAVPAKELSKVHYEPDVILDFRNPNMEVDFSTNGLIESITTATVNLTVHQEIMYYVDHGGAYSFMPQGKGNTFEMTPLSRVYYNGHLRKEVVYTFAVRSGRNITVSYNLHMEGDNSDMIDMDYTLEAGSNENVIVRFSTSIDSDTLHTDNGVGVIDHKLYTASEIAESYFPSVSFAYIRDSKSCFICNSDRSRGASIGNSKRGVLEFSLHRNLIQDDIKGLGEPINDTTTITVKNQCYIKHGFYNEERRNAIIFDNPLKSLSMFDFKDIDSPLLTLETLNTNIPRSIHILTFSKEHGSYLLRLQNTDETQPALIDLVSIFKRGKITVVVETDLTSVKKYNMMDHTHRVDFNTTYQGIIGRPNLHPVDKLPEYTPTINFIATLMPLEIKTFYIK